MSEAPAAPARTARRRHRVAIAALVSLCLAPSCSVLEGDGLPPEGQIVFGVATDAWVPRGAGDAFEPVPRNVLFERLRVELFAPGESEPCRECFRDFAVEHGVMNEGRATVGFVPRPGVSGYRVRVKLYHAGASESAAEPRPAATVEAVVSLPAVSPDGIVQAHVVLRTDDLARPRGTLDEPVPAESGPPPKGLAGTWHAELLRGCTEPAREGEACVPGGAYWMGDPGLAVPYERLVGLSPFYVDTREVTVAEVRASGLATGDVLSKGDPLVPDTDPTKAPHYCTYSARAAEREALPVNCVTRELAAKVCALRGATLVSEAQFEYVQGSRRDATFPWGESYATCGDAVFGRSWETSKPADFRECAAAGLGVAKPGSGALDRVRMPDGNEVLDLAGNVAEWVLDTYQRYDEPCYRDNPVVDPVCRERSAAANALAVRGGTWADLGGNALRATVKQSLVGTGVQSPRVGFRCARAVER